MLWSLAFDRLGVVISDLYFVDPNAGPGNEGAERGVRLELRIFERDGLVGSVYSAVPIRIDRPIWRLDLLETVDSPPGTLDRAHHHPRFQGWEPGPRVFDEALSADPVTWTAARLAATEVLLNDAGVAESELGVDDAQRLREAGPMIVAMLEDLLAEVAAGRAGLEPAGSPTGPSRSRRHRPRLRSRLRARWRRHRLGGDDFVRQSWL